MFFSFLVINSRGTDTSKNIVKICNLDHKYHHISILAFYGVSRNCMYCRWHLTTGTETVIPASIHWVGQTGQHWFQIISNSETCILISATTVYFLHQHRHSWVNILTVVIKGNVITLRKFISYTEELHPTSWSISCSIMLLDSDTPIKVHAQLIITFIVNPP